MIQADLPAGPASPLVRGLAACLSSVTEVPFAAHGQRLAEPCAHLERLLGPGLLRPLIHRGGLRVDILTDGLIGQGSAVSTNDFARK